MIKEIMFVRQLTPKECGVASLTMMANYYLNQSFHYQDIRSYCQLSPKGLSIYNLCKAASEIGLKTLPVKCSFNVLKKYVQYPVIALIERYHYVVITNINSNYVEIINPSFGLQKFSVLFFKKIWYYNESLEGILIAMNQED